MILYDHPASGNCMKARILLRQLELPYERVTVDLFKGETRTPSTSRATRTGACRFWSWTPGETIAESARSSRTSPREPNTSRPNGSRARG